jgi:hypothetical protein
MYEDRVERGAALLDRARPGWEREVSPDRLAILSCTDCLLGQLYGHSVCGVREVCDALSTPSNLFMFSLWKHGFDLSVGEYFDTAADAQMRYSDALADAWRALIRRRAATAT